MIDQDQLAGYASTRNQGWLQSGAWYAAHNQPAVARLCRGGAAAIRCFAAAHGIESAVQSAIPAFYRFATMETRDLFIEACAAQAIRATPLAPGAAPRDITADSPYAWAAQTDDCPFDTHRVLAKLAEAAAARGARFHAVPHLNAVRIDKRDGWTVWTPDLTIRCAAVVLAAGPFIPTILGDLLPDIAFGFKRSKIPVLVVHQPLSIGMALTPLIPAGPNIVPFESADGVEGASICLAGEDIQIDSAGDFTCSIELSRAMFQRVAEVYPRLRRSMGDGLPFHWYACQKVSWRGGAASGEARHYVFIDHAPPQHGCAPGLFSFYPGKLTSALVAAEQVADAVRSGVPQTAAVRQGGMQAAPRVARQRYYLQPTHLARDSAEGITISSLAVSCA